MQVTDKFVRLDLSIVVVNRDIRQRRDIDTSDIEPSIERNGVLQPIIIKSSYELVAGERRLMGSRRLVARGIARAKNGQDISTIPVRFIEDLDEVEAQIIELEENIKRRDLDWKDLVASVGKIHGLYCKQDPDWTLAETANEVGLSSGIISMYLKVNGYMDDERVQKAGTVREAYNLLDRRDQRAAGEALQEILDTTNVIIPHIDAPALTPVELKIVPPAGLDERLIPPAPKAPDETLVCQSFVDWVQGYAGKKFNLVHCDFPYGVNLFGSNGKTSGPQRSQMGQGGGSYKDDSETYFALLEAFCKHLDKFMSVSAHLLFWYSEKHGDATRAMFKKLAPSLRFAPFPLIWVKSDNAGIAARPNYEPRHIYETCLFASRGDRQILRIVADAYSAPTDKRFHPSTKPEPMLKHFMSMVVDENTSLLDPTCGSASSIRAAEELGAVRCLGMDIDPECIATAKTALKASRTLRAANGRLQ